MLETLLPNVNPSVLVCGVVCLSVIYLIQNRRITPKNIPPMPEKPQFVFGHARSMKGDRRVKLKEWVAKSGDILSYYIGPQLVIVFSSYDVMKEAFVKKADHFSDRPKSYYGEKLFGYKGVIGTSGEHWKEQRSAALTILREFGMGKNTLADKVDEEVDDYIETLRSTKEAPTDARALTNCCVSNVISSIIGKRFDLDDKGLMQMTEIMNELIVLSAHTLMPTIFPILDYIPGDPYKLKLIKEQTLNLNEFLIKTFVDPVKEIVQKGEEPPASFVASYLQEIKKKKATGKPTTLDEENLIISIDNLFFAGSETTSTTIMWFILLMVHYPDVLTKIQDEMDNAIGKEKRPNIQDRSKLAFFNACVMETQRFSSIVPLSLSHLCTKTTTISGYTIPAGTIIIPNLDSVLASEKTWGDPHNFRPERFIDDNGILLHKEELIPFGIGRRICLGESLAKMELFLFLSGICQTFNILPEDPDNMPPLKGVFGITCAPEAFKARFVERA